MRNRVETIQFDTQDVKPTGKEILSAPKATTRARYQPQNKLNPSGTGCPQSLSMLFAAGDP
jgi:hypothetical protein